MIWLTEILKTWLEQLLIMLHDKVFNIAKNAKYDGYQCGLALMLYKFFYKKLLVVVLKMKICQTSN